MVGSRHGTGSGTMRLFTDREEPIAHFEEALDTAQPWVEGRLDAYRALVWYGVGGQGKTELRKELCRRIEARRSGGANIALGAVDFETPEHRSPLGALLKLRAGLGRGRRVVFPTFDFAYATWFARARPGADIRRAHPELFARGESEIVDDLSDWAAEAASAAVETGAALLPGAGLLYKHGHRLRGRLREWWAARPVKEKIARIDALSEPEILEQLPVWLGFDLWRAAQATNAPRLVVMLDTYEALWRDSTRQSALLIDGWVRALVEAAPGTLFAIFGRDRLRWAELDADWERILDQQLLGGLSDADADRFLRTAAVPTRRLRGRIVEAAQGLPLYLDLALDLFEDLVARDGLVPDPDAFGHTLAAVLDRFLRHLSEDEERELRLASYSDDLGERLFGDLAEAFLGGAAAADWARLGRRSFMTPGGEGRLEMHALMREALRGREAAERRETWARVHDWLFRRYEARARPESARDVTPDHEVALEAAARHLRRVDPTRYMPWLSERIAPFREAARWTVLERLLASAEDEADDTWRAWALHELARVRQAMGRYAEAEDLYEQALAITEATLGDRHPSYAATLHGLARVRVAMGRYAEAEELYEQALAIEEATRGVQDPNYAATVHSLAFLRQAEGRHDEAEELYEKALAIWKATRGDRHPHYATTLHNLASLRLAMGRTAEAEDFYERALAITEATRGNQHSSYAATLHELAAVLQAMGRYAEAETLYDRALAILQAALSDRHPRYANTLHELARVRQAVGRNNEAESLYERALAITEATVGNGHPLYATTLHELARVRQAMGRYAESETLYERALAIYEATLGNRHPDYAITLASLALARAELGRPHEAVMLYEQALEILTAAHVDTHPHVGRGRLRHAQILEKMGRRDEARSTAAAALSILDQTLGPDHPWTQEARALLDRLEGRPDAAE